MKYLEIHTGGDPRSLAKKLHCSVYLGFACSMLGKKRFQQIASQMVMQKWWWIPWYKVRTVNNSKICDYTSKFPRNPKGAFSGLVYVCQGDSHASSSPSKLDFFHSLKPETNSSPLKMCRAPIQETRKYSNNPFSGAMLVSGRVTILNTILHHPMVPPLVSSIHGSLLQQKQSAWSGATGAGIVQGLVWWVF